MVGGTSFPSVGVIGGRSGGGSALEAVALMAALEVEVAEEAVEVDLQDLLARHPNFLPGDRWTRTLRAGNRLHSPSGIDRLAVLR